MQSNSEERSTEKEREIRNCISNEIIKQETMCMPNKRKKGIKRKDSLRLDRGGWYNFVAGFSRGPFK